VTTPPDTETAPPLRRARRLGKRAAILALVAIVGVLALGWLGDTLGQFAPRATFHNGETQQAGLYRVALNIDPLPARAGEQVTIQARFADDNDRPATNVPARLVMTMPAMDMAPGEALLVPTVDGAYAARTTFPMSGSWLVRVELTPPGAAKLRADFDVPVR
jgi:hypothetical protein